MAHIYDVGTRAWQPDEKEGWVASEVEEKLVDGDKVKLVFRLQTGEVRSSSSFCFFIFRAAGHASCGGAHLLTLYAAEQNRRDDPGSHPGRQRCQPATPHEPGHVGGQRRPHQLVTSQRASWYAPAHVLGGNTMLMILHSAPGHQTAVCTEGDLHILGNRPDCDESLCPRGLAVCAGHGAGLCWQAAILWRTTFIRYC